jgi:hypothetical protein
VDVEDGVLRLRLRLRWLPWLGGAPEQPGRVQLLVRGPCLLVVVLVLRLLLPQRQLLLLQHRVRQLLVLQLQLQQRCRRGAGLRRGAAGAPGGGGGGAQRDVLARQRRGHSHPPLALRGGLQLRHHAAALQRLLQLRRGLLRGHGSGRWRRRLRRRRLVR